MPNYLRVKLKKLLELPYDRVCMHECVFSDKSFSRFNISTLDVAKRLIDYRFHPPTIYFPLIVKGALMIEPTETESKSTLDAFVEAFKNIMKEAEENPEILKKAPHTTPVKRLDEVRAARNPVLRK
jgi:glycine dehydrogenase subunit 2